MSFFGLFKRKKYPPFPALDSYPNKKLYFSRTCEFVLVDETHIGVIPKFAAGMISLDPWQQMIFLAATGKKSIEKFVYQLADKYETNIPANLDRQVIENLEKLGAQRLVTLHAEKRELPDHFKKPK